jgi:hypothetical protein
VKSRIDIEWFGSREEQSYGSQWEIPRRFQRKISLDSSNENSSKERMKEKRANLSMKKSFEIISKRIVVTI